MTSDGHTCGLGPERLGPFLLGELEGVEREEVRMATLTCPACTAELPRLRRVVGLLGQADPAAVSPDFSGVPPRLGAPPHALDGVLRRVSSERRRGRRRRLLLGAAVLVVGLAVGAGTTVTLLRDPDDDGRVVQLAGAGGASGTASVVETASGSVVQLEVRGLEPRTAYGAWLARPDGTRQPAGSFRTDATGWAQVQLSAGLTPQEARTAGVTRLGGDDVLVAVLPG